MSARRRLSARGRVALATTATLAVTVAVLVIIAYAVTVRSLDAATDRALLREAQAYQAAMRSAPTTDTMPSATREYLRARTAASAAGPDPVLLVSFGGGTPNMRVISNTDLRLEDASGNVVARTPPAVSSFGTLEYAGRTYRVLASPVRDVHGSTVGVFEAALDVEAQRRTAATVATILTSAGVIALTIGLALAFWSAAAALEPLRRMAADAASVSHAEPGRRIAYAGPADELGSLASSVNAMLDRLEAGAEEQRRFIADASHELRTPVAIVRGNVELLGKRSDLPEGAQEQLAMIDDESARMARLLEELLSLARLQGPRQRAFQPLYVPTLVSELQARGRMLDGERHFSAACSSDGWVLGDPDLLDQALLNIVRNAVAHTEDGGSIAIACETAGKRVRITVTDDGPGIPAEELARIFDRFYRAQKSRDASSGGAGLGLAIAKGLVELHGGTIAAENVAGGGARFTVELPRISAPA